MKLLGRWFSVGAVVLTGAVASSGMGAAHAGTSSVLPPPAVSAQQILSRLGSGHTRGAMGIGSHSFLRSLRYGLGSVVLPGVAAVPADDRIWTLQFIDPHPTSGLCAVTTVALSAQTGKQLWLGCRATLPSSLAGLRAPGFGVVSLVKALHCRCATGGPRGFHFGVGAHSYVSVVRYGTYGGLFPGNSLQRSEQATRIWTVTYLDPQVTADRRDIPHRGANICTKNTVDLRADSGRDTAWSCYPSA
jgi:hypothetical protein